MASDVDRPAPHLVAEGVSAGYGGAPIITDVSVQVGARELVAVVGPNGSGKSTLLKSLVGVLRVTSGAIHLGDRAITNWATEEVARAGVGYVPQVDDVFGPMTVRENLEMGGYLLPPRAVGARVEHVLSVFPALGRMLARRAEKLSGGERKMLAMGRVLMLQPGIFLLDEPTANLAPAIAHTLLHDHIQRLATTGAGVLLVEQRARSALEICSWTYVMGGGRCRTAGRSDDLAARPDFAEAFLGGAPTHV